MDFKGLISFVSAKTATNNFTTIMLIGPPGIGKSSSAAEIAAAMSRQEFSRIAKLKAASTSSRGTDKPHFDTMDASDLDIDSMDFNSDGGEETDLVIKLSRSKKEIETVKNDQLLKTTFTEEYRPAVCTVIDLTTHAPEDLLGLPRITDTGRKRSDGTAILATEYAPPAWFERLCDPAAYGVLVLDDLPAAAANVQTATRQLVLDRMVNGLKISDRIQIIVTGNRRSDRANASTLPSQFVNAVCMVELNVSYEEWAVWYGARGGDMLIPAFLQTKTALFSQTPTTVEPGASFPTPRSWTLLGEQVKVARATHTLGEIAAGFVGVKAAGELMAFEMLRANLVDIAEFMENPRKALPNIKEISDAPDKMTAIATLLAEHTAALVKDAKPDSPKVGTRKKLDVQKDIIAQYARALNYLSVERREMIVVSVHTYTNAGGPPEILVSGLKQASLKDPSIRDLFAQLRESTNSTISPEEKARIEARKEAMEKKNKK